VVQVIVVPGVFIGRLLTEPCDPDHLGQAASPFAFESFNASYLKRTIRCFLKVGIVPDWDENFAQIRGLELCPKVIGIPLSIRLGWCSTVQSRSV